jgi:hypothetical protein
LSTGSFQTVDGPEIKNPTISVWMPLSDRKDVKDLKVVTMIKGEFESKTIDSKALIKKSEHNTIIVPFEFKRPLKSAPSKGEIYFLYVYLPMS